MPALIDSAPDCIAKVDGAKPADDSADFIVQAPYMPCKDEGTGSIMTFGPGSTYGDGGAAADTSYYILTWVGIAFMVVVLVLWVILERRRLSFHAQRLSGRLRGHDAANIPQVQPGTTRGEEI
jgi:hypothetical protein